MGLFGKTKPTIYIWLNDGTIPASNFGGRWVVHKPALRAMLAETATVALTDLGRPAEV